VNIALERLIERLRSETALSSDPWKQVNAYIAVDNALEAAIAEAKGRVLGSAVAWGADGQELARRAHEATRSLGNIGLFISEACEAVRADDANDVQLQQVIVIALANYGSSLRWSAMLRNGRNNASYPAVHSLYLRAERIGVALAPGRIFRDGETRTLNAESHYLRNLLLPLLCHESLDPQQLEVVDNWLWDWLPDYRLTRQMLATAPRLWVDLEGRTGVSLRQFMPEGEDVRHLVIARMPQQIREATAAFHEGQIPGSGCSTAFPIEAHTGVLDHLQMLWDQVQNGAPKRRHDRVTRLEPLRIEAMVGLDEIVAASHGHRREEGVRWMHVHDESEGGAALIVDAALWETIWHGDLIGIRTDATAIPHVGVVVRKFARDSGDCAIGVQWIALEPRLLSINDLSGEAGPRSIPTIYVPGENDSGDMDSIILDERSFAHDSPYELAFADRVFEVRLNRLLRRGRGWVAAGYEIVGIRKRTREALVA